MPVADVSSDRRVDHSALRTNQAFIITLLITAFILDRWPLAAFVAAVMLIGTLIPAAGLFKAVYFILLRPAGIAQPVVRLDNPEPHLFAQGVGGAVLIVATIAFLAGAPVIGWALSWLVVALAALNLFAGVCVGCLMYYQLRRLGVPGFTRAPVTDLAAAQRR
jgi:phosphoglycerol transferase MdoB-like AlkP superfamily enzyme